LNTAKPCHPRWAALGLALVQNGRRVLFIRTTDLVQRLQVARRDLALIVLGSVHDGLRVVQSGLDANDKVIVAGLQKIFAPDTKVKPNLVAMGARPQS
jgi:hypothetical protein